MVVIAVMRRDATSEQHMPGAAAFDRPLAGQRWD
jgi:hypothetical protein